MICLEKELCLAQYFFTLQIACVFLYCRLTTREEASMNHTKKHLMTEVANESLHLKQPLENLSIDFSPSEWEWRVGHSGITNSRPRAMVLAYVTARALQERLDLVCGPANWTCEYQAAPNASHDALLCSIGIRVAYDEMTRTSNWVYKVDGASNSKVEPVKGGISNSFKRAAVLWGMGRHLYNLASHWADFAPRKNEDFHQAFIEGTKYDWYPPREIKYKNNRKLNSSPLLEYTKANPAILDEGISDKDIPF